MRGLMLAYFGPAHTVYMLVRLAWWETARRQLQRRDPLHPDLPHIVMTVNRLKTEMER